MRGLRLGSWVYLGLVLGFPLAALLWHFPEIQPGLEAFLSRAFRNTLLVASGTALLSLLIGSGAAFVLAKISLPGTRLLSLLLVTPIFFVPYQMALAWDALLPSGLNAWLFSPAGVIGVLTSSFSPVVFWFAWIAFKAVPPEEEEAGLMTAPPGTVFRRITLTKVYPALLAGTFLVFILAFTELGVPTYLGVPVLPYEVLIQFSTLYDFRAAVAASWPMAALGVLLLFLEYRLFRKSLLFYQRAGKPQGLIFSPSPAVKAVLLLSLLLLVFVFLFLPLSALVKEAASFRALKFALKNGLPSLLRGLFYATVAGFLSALWALAVFYSRKGKGHSLMSGLALAGLFLPPAVLATGILYFWNQGVLSLLYGTFGLLILGYLARYSFFSYRSLETAFEHLDPSAWEAALFTGHGPLAILRHILFPQVRSWFFLAWMLVFIFSVNELGLSTMLYPPEGEPLVVRLYTLSVNNPLSHSAALALLHSVGTLLGVALLYSGGFR